MSDAALGSSHNEGKGFFRTFKDTFFWTSNSTSISRVSDRSEEAEATYSARLLSDQDRADVPNGLTFRGDGEDKHTHISSPSTSEASLAKSKSRSKFLKKKEIVSSSTAVPRVEICTGRKCRAKGSEQLLSAFEASSSGRVEIAHTTCMKVCKQGMNVRVTKDGTTFDMHNEVDPQDCQKILSKHFEW